jgi:hypothetical protein
MKRNLTNTLSVIHFIASCAPFAGTAVAALIFSSACSHQPIIPEAKNVVIAREMPSSKCTEIGAVKGYVATTTGTLEQAIEDMKLDAARRGANFVLMQSTGAMGTSASGTAYVCP